MIEADVNLGHFTGDLIWDLIPIMNNNIIMAYLPQLHSDLSLDLFLDKVIEVSISKCCRSFVEGPHEMKSKECNLRNSNRVVPKEPAEPLR